MQADILRAPVGPGAMHVDRYGHGGTAVILLHGFGTCNFLGRAIPPAITAAGHTAYSVDLFGHGQSDRPLDADFGIAAQAEYLDAAMTVLRVPRAVVVGVDLGGDVAMKLAANRPERVEKLVLINTPAFDELPARDITQMQRRTARFAFSLQRGVMGAAPLLEGVLRGSVADAEHMPMKLIVWGDEDRWVDQKVADRLVNAIPEARLVRLAGIARLVPEENPEHLSELLLDFIKRRAAA